MISPPSSSKNTFRSTFSDGSSSHGQIMDDDVANVIINDVERRHTEGLAILNQELKQETLIAQPLLDNCDSLFLAFNGNSSTPMSSDIKGTESDIESSNTNTIEDVGLNLNEDMVSNYEVIGPEEPTRLAFIGRFDPKCPLMLC